MMSQRTNPAPISSKKVKTLYGIIVRGTRVALRLRKSQDIGADD
jgi:hypothetical protein